MARKTYFNSLAKITLANFISTKLNTYIYTLTLLYKNIHIWKNEKEKSQTTNGHKNPKRFFSIYLEKVKWPHQHLEFVCQYHNNRQNGP